ncbi:MAG: hypothetical protein KDK08_19430 [Rhizobiaceae bacterium]|nr:hypothetical protein [Rhizobiaceae bacterium]
MAIFSPRDKSRTESGKTASLVRQHTRPPDDQGGWFAITRDFLESAAFRSLSVNARKCLDRLIIEHISHNRLENGRLIVTHEQFIEYGVTGEYVGDALDELAYKGLLKAERGKAGNGTAHPTIFTLTFDGRRDGLPATDEWKKCTLAEARLWSEVVRNQRAQARAKVGRKNKSSLRVSEIRPLRVSEIRRVKQGA